MFNKNKENITLSNQIKGTIQNRFTKRSYITYTNEQLCLWL